MSYDFDRAIVCEAKRGAEILIGETRLEHGRPVPLLVAVHSGKWEREQTYSFDVIQAAGEKIVGGYTVQLVDSDRIGKSASGDERID